MHEVAQRPSERRSLEVDLFRQRGFESYYKFTREKKRLAYAVKKQNVNKLIARCFFLFLLLPSFLLSLSLGFFSFSSSLLKKNNT